jgi:hypothetical protein
MSGSPLTLLKASATAATIPLRPAETVMKLERLGSFHQTRLSFLRSLLRRLGREGWSVERVRWEIDARSQGVAVYEARGNGRIYSLVAFAHDLDPAKRTDRVIAEEWDATFALHDGRIGDVDIARLAANVPRQEAGRLTAAEIVMARANRSVRLFDEVVAALARGEQPAAEALDAVGYLMRTTAVYGSGKFGMADRAAISDRAELRGPFAAEMLAVWLIRAFTVDLVEHLARVRSPESAVGLDRELRRRLGVGNSTGLGMAPFVVNHPILFHRWILARETALARVRAVDGGEASPEDFARRLAAAREELAHWRVADPLQARRIDGLERDLARLQRALSDLWNADARPNDAIHRFAEAELGLEAQEFVVSLLLEAHGDLIDDLCDDMALADGDLPAIDGTASLASLASAIVEHYAHALSIDFADPKAKARFWYVSEEKLEPRLGERDAEDHSDREQPLAIARDVAALHDAISQAAPDRTVGAFLAGQPEFRHVVRRVQMVAAHPYSEIRDNLIDAAMRPIDLLRCKLSFFGATEFDPRSDRWVRISLFRNAPFPDELEAGGPQDAPEPRSAAVAIPAGKYSVNELGSLVRKAARGSGLSWGLADEAGRCAMLLAEAQRPPLAFLADHLQDHHASRLAGRLDMAGRSIVAAGPLPPCAIHVGACIGDHAALLSTGPLAIDATLHRPVLLLPFLADVSRRLGAAITVEASGVGESITPGNLAAAIERWSALAAIENPVIACDRSVPVDPDARAAPARVDVDDATWSAFEALAANTYVPRSDASRLAGAGAGLSDND